MDINNFKERPIKNKDSHVHMEFSNLKDEYMHFHNESELILVLRGELEFKIHHQNYKLEKGDLLFVDRDDLHSVHSGSKDVLFLRMYIDFAKFENMHPNAQWMIFICEKENAQTQSPVYSKKAEILRALLAHTMQAVIEEKGTEEIYSEFENIVSFLIEGFRGFFMFDNEFHPNKDNSSLVDIERIERIMKHIDLNMSEKITLVDIANMEHLNTYYISHLIKNTLGLSFQGLLNHLRAEMAEKLMALSNLSLTQISEEAGFSSLTYMNKTFFKLHGITPSVYRKTHLKQERFYGENFSKEEAIRLLSQYGSKDNEEKITEEIILNITSNENSQNIPDPEPLLNIVANNLSDLIIIENKIDTLKDINCNSIILDINENELTKYAHAIIDIIQKINEAGMVLNHAQDFNGEITENHRLYNRFDIQPYNGKIDEEDFYKSPFDIINKIKEKKPICLPIGNKKGALFSNGIYTLNYLFFKEFTNSHSYMIDNMEEFYIINRIANNHYITLMNPSKDFPKYFKVKLVSAREKRSFFMTKVLISENSPEMKILENIKENQYLKESVVRDINKFSGSPSDIQLISKKERYNLSIDVPPNSILFVRIIEV